MARRRLNHLFLAGLVLSLVGCASYQTPGAGIGVGGLSKADEDIAEVMKREPAAQYPTRLALARVQSPGYTTRNTYCYGKGRYCLVTTREIEKDQDFARVSRLPMVSHVTPLGRMLVAEEINSIKDLRLGAASLKTDMLLLYSIDTRFNVDSTDIGPLALISLGFLPNKKARVNSTASAALIDVRTGFVYGVAESTATEDQRASAWSTNDAIEASRLEAEATAFHGLLDELEKLWQGVVAEHAQTRAGVN
jgi:hypothetical protein